MTAPSKRVVRDAIRILGYAVQHNVGLVAAAFALGLYNSPGDDLAWEARFSQAAASVSDRACRAAAESLLIQGWLP